jgi:hypothetical protein
MRKGRWMSKEKVLFGSLPAIVRVPLYLVIAVLGISVVMIAATAVSGP